MLQTRTHHSLGSIAREKNIQGFVVYVVFLNPSLNMSSGSLGLKILKTWTELLTKAGIVNQPFARHEHILIHTCIAASTGIAIANNNIYNMHRSV